MKLRMEAVKDISVLIAEGAMTPENFAVLRAGVKKLFKDGKNKIILELPDSAAFTPVVLREFASLNLIAAELSGSIVLAKIAPLTRAKIEAFAKPSAVRCFGDRAAAVEFFHPPGAEEIPNSAPTTLQQGVTPAAAIPDPSPPKGIAIDAPAATTPSASVAPSADPVSEDKAKQFKAEIRAKEMGDLGTSRKRLAELEAENTELKSRLAELVVTRRDPPDLDAWKEKVKGLERQLADAIKTAQDATATKK